MPNSYFSRASKQYNFPVSERHEPFINSIRHEHGGELGKVLDVGCGDGIAGRSGLARNAVEGAEEVVGVDPSVEQSPPHVDSFYQSTLSEAPLPEDYFDTAISFMVMEHIEKPRVFFSSMRKILRPGGSCIFMTTNPDSFFGLTVRLLGRVGVEDKILNLIKSKTDYHHKKEYKFQGEDDVRRYAKRFDCEFVYSESYTSYKSYFTSALVPAWHMLKLKRKLWKSRKSLVHMIGRCSKR